MTAAAKPVPKGRLDRDARRDAILDVAQGVFLEEGFSAASMSEIATRLGGSKGTLYNYFKSKDELFEAVVRRHCFWRQEALFGDLDAAFGAETALLRLAETYIRITLNEDTMRSFRLVIAEVERSPQIGRSFYEEGPKFGADSLAVMVADWMAAGELREDDPLEAAEFFLGLCKGRFYMPRLLNYVPELTEAQVKAAAATSVRAFLTIYAAG